MKKAKRLLSIILTVMLVTGAVGTLPSMAAVSDEGVIFSFDGSSYYSSWTPGDDSGKYGSIVIGQAGFGSKAATDLVAKATYGGTDSQGIISKQFMYTVQGDTWSQTDRSKYGYLVLTCELYPDDSLEGFQWTRRGGNTISTATTTTLVNYIVKNQWNTITTYYDFTANSSGNYTTKTYVNGTLVDTNTAVSAITDTASNGVQDHIYTNIYGATGNTFYLDNVKYYMTNDAPDDVILSTDGTSGTFDWTAASAEHGTVEHSIAGAAAKSADDVYTKATTGEKYEEFRWYIKNSGYPNDASKYKYLIMSAQILPTSSSDIATVVWRNRDGTLSVPDGSNYISNALNAGQWNTVTVVYSYKEVLANPETSYRKYTSYTYVNGNLVYTMNDAYSIMPADYDASYNRDNWRIQLTVTTSGAKTFGLDNVQIYQTNSYPDVTMPAIASGENYVVTNGMLKVYKDATVAVSDFVGAKVWDSTLTNQITDGSIDDGNIVTVEDGNKITYCTVSSLKDYDVVYGGAAYDSAAHKVIAGNLTASVYKPDETEISLITAQFDAKGNLHKAAVNKVGGSGLVETASFAVDEIEGSIITVFVFENMTSIKPLANFASVSYR